jgi:shikimate dehydrogenase
MGMRYSAEGSKSPLSPDVIMKDVLVYDIVYNPLETPLLKMAREAGAKILGGLPMLVYQGAASFKLWTGKEAPVDIMFAVAKKALLGKSGS